MSTKTYVAPLEAPPTRRPPVTEVGVLGWLRHNLFSSTRDAITTILTAGILLYVIIDLGRWAFLHAQWDIAFLNMRQLFVGPEFPIEEIWRINLAAYLVVFLCMLSIGYWGTLTRFVLGSVIVFTVALIVIPWAGQFVTKPTIYYWADATRIDQVNFIAQEGQDLTFTLDPLTSPEEFGVENFPGGYIGNDNSLPNTSWDSFDTNSQQVLLAQAVDPSQYDLNLAIQVWNAQGEVIAESPYSEGSHEALTFNWIAPADDWYTFTLARAPEVAGSQGFAWLKVDNLEVFYSTVSMRTAREEQYGTPPVLDCNGCGTQVNRTDMRFVGDRTILQWVSLQLSPFLIGIREVFLFCLAAGIAGYALAKILPRTSLPNKYMVRGIIVLWLIAIPIWYVLIKGIGIEPFPTVRTSGLGGMMLAIILTVVPLIASFPLGILLALGRRSDLPAVRILCTIFIEVFRGVPLITLLFSARYIVQYFADFMSSLDLIIRVMIVLTVFTAAYLAEVIRGGLQIIPKGQYEAAHAVGLSGFWTTILIVLPQALRAVIPAILGQFLSLFKDTSLVALISLYEIIGSMRRTLGDPLYLPYGREGWTFVFIAFFLLSYAMAEVSRKLEETGSGAVRRKQL